MNQTMEETKSNIMNLTLTEILANNDGKANTAFSRESVDAIKKIVCEAMHAAQQERGESFLTEEAITAYIELAVEDELV